MNDYKLMVAPFEHDGFDTLNKKQAELYFQWYVEQSLSRIKQLCEYIHSTGETVFSCDYTPESFIDLWNWFESQICMVEKTKEEYQSELDQFPKWMHDSIPKEQFSVKTLALITDISFYFAETFIKCNPKIKWGYFTKPKNEVSVNMPVLLGFKKNMKLDPRRIVHVCAQRSYEKHDKNRLIDAYKIWVSYIEEESISAEEKMTPDERPLLSIAPILKYIQDFAGSTGTYTTKEEIKKAEKRFGQELPLPFKEFYEYLPKEYFSYRPKENFKNINDIQTMSRLRKRKNGKITFLDRYDHIEAIELGSSLIYHLLYTGKALEPAGVLDGYLAVEFLKKLWEGHIPNLAMGEWSAKETRPIKERMTSFFTELVGISSQIAVGNMAQLYDVCKGDGIAVYSEMSGCLLLYAKEKESLTSLEIKLGLREA